MELTLENYSLEFPSDNAVQNTVENARFPYFASVFYDLVLEDGTVPDQTRFFETYLERNKNSEVSLGGESFKIRDLPQNYLNALRTRLFKRSYPSLVRDLHCGLLLNENSFYNVFSSLEADTESGIDLILDSKYAVHLWLATGNSMHYRNLKKDHRHDYDNSEFENFELPLDPFYNLGDFELHGKEVGDFYLYSLNEIDYLIDTIEDFSTN